MFNNKVRVCWTLSLLYITALPLSASITRYRYMGDKGVPRLWRYYTLFLQESDSYTPSFGGSEIHISLYNLFWWNYRFYVSAVRRVTSKFIGIRGPGNGLTMCQCIWYELNRSWGWAQNKGRKWKSILQSVCAGCTTQKARHQRSIVIFLTHYSIIIPLYFSLKEDITKGWRVIQNIQPSPSIRHFY